MAKRGKDNDHTKSGQLRRRGQYRIQHVMMMIKTLAYKRRNITVKLLSAYYYSVSFIPWKFRLREQIQGFEKIFEGDIFCIF